MDPCCPYVPNNFPRAAGGFGYAHFKVGDENSGWVHSFQSSLHGSLWGLVGPGIKWKL